MKARVTYTIALGLLLAIVFISFKLKTASEPENIVLRHSLVDSVVNRGAGIHQHSAKMHLLSATVIVGPAVGIAGMKTDLYRSYEWLVEKGPDSLLLALAETKNSYTKTYAFVALCKRKHPIIKDLFEKNMSDTTILKTIDGCLGGSCSLNVLWFSALHDAVSDTVHQRLYKILFSGSNVIPLCVSSITQE